MKSLFKGTFNYSGHNFVLFTHSNRKESAFLNFISQIAKKLNVGKRTVIFKFDGLIDNYYIEEIKNERRN